MRAHLQTKSFWGVVKGTQTQITPKDAAATVEETKEMNRYQEKVDGACGEIYLGLEESQHVHVKDVLDDPKKMWEKLQQVHVQKKPGSRFNAYDALFAIRKAEGETLADLMSRVDRAMQDIKILRPTSFEIDTLDQELQCMTLIRALPESYDNFVTSLILNASDSLKIDELQSAFAAEERQRQTRQSSSTSPTAFLAQSKSKAVHCDFCDTPGHIQEKCYSFIRAQKSAKEWRAKKKAAKSNGATVSKEEGNSATIVEVAGNASALSSAEHSAWLASSTSSDWNTDTGASSHMTPHRQWFTSYIPHVVPIHLADGSVIHSAGLGSVEFEPVIDGNMAQRIVFHDVLHVPSLGCNLLSLLSLSNGKGYEIVIKCGKIVFKQEGIVRFTATVNGNNIGYLDGKTCVSVHAANSTATVPLNLSTWHS